MAELNVEKAYAKALYELSVEQDKEKEILTEAKEVRDIFQQESDLRKFVTSPVIAAAQKKSVLENIFAGQISEELLHFICLLIDRGRVRYYEKIVEAMENIAKEKEGRLEGIIYSAKLLTNEQLDRFEEETSKLLRHVVRLYNHTDTRLIGGVKIFIDGKIIDASFAKRLSDIKAAMI